MINVENVGVRLWQSSAICLRAFARSAFYLLDRHAPLAMTKGTKWISTHHSYHSRARGPRKYECICGVDKAGILYLFSNNFCHSCARGPHKYECICGVDKAGMTKEVRADARSAFLFTGSPRSFHSLAMTKGTKWIITHSLTTPSASRHPSNGGELGTFPSRNSSPLAGGGGRKTVGGWYE